MSTFTFRQLDDIKDAFSIEIPKRKIKSVSQRKPRIRFAIRYEERGFYSAQHSQDYRRITETTYSTDIYDAHLFDSIATLQDVMFYNDLQPKCTITRVDVIGKERRITYTEPNKWFGAGSGADISEFFKYQPTK